MHPASHSFAVHGYYSPDADLSFLGLPAPGSAAAPPSPPDHAPGSVVQLSWFAGGYVTVPWVKELHLECAALTDFFTETARMRSYRTDEKAAPVDLFRQQALAKQIVRKATRKYREVSEFSLRHGMFGKVGTGGSAPCSESVG